MRRAALTLAVLAAADLTLAVLPTPEDWAPRIGLMVAGIALIGLGLAILLEHLGYLGG